MEDEHILRFRCHIGHAYSAESLASDQADALERAISIALRTLEDSAALCRRLAREAKESNRVQSNLLFERRAREAEENAATLRGVFQSQSRNGQSEPARSGGNGAPASVV
jgi:two-component system chemotaxis response regulator CheB